MAGIKTTREPDDCFSIDDSKKRPDFVARKLNRPGKRANELFDVSIVFPGGKAHLKLGSAHLAGIAAHSQFQLKSRSYSPLAFNSDYDFQGLIFESYGKFHEKATDLINFCCTKMASRSGRPFAPIKKYWMTRISVAVVRGTARMILTKYFDVVASSGVKNKGCLDSLDHSHSVFASPFPDDHD